MMSRNILIQMISSGLSGLITFLTLSLSARLFGPEVLGILAYLIGLTGLVFAFSDLGFSQAHIHFTAAFKKPSLTLGTFLRIKFKLLFTAAVVMIFLALIKQTEFKGLFLLILIIELTSRYAESILITFEALQQSLPQNLVRLTAKLIKLAAIVLLANYLKSSFGYSLAFVAESLTLLLLAFWLLRRFLPLHFSRSLTKQYWHYSLPFFLIIPFSYLQDNSLVVILKQFQPATVVGYYSAAFNLASFIKTLFGAVMIFFFPKISSLFAAEKFALIQRFTDLTLKYLLLFFTPLYICLFLLRREVVNFVLGSQFIPAVPVFSLFLAGMFILMLSAPYGSILYATRNHRPLILINLISLIVAVIINLLLAPRLGASGTVIASLCVWSGTGLAQLYLVKRQLKLTVLPKALVFILPAILILVVTNQAITYYQADFMLKLALTIIALLIYGASIFLFRAVNYKDIKTLVKLTKIK